MVEPLPASEPALPGVDAVASASRDAELVAGLRAGDPAAFSAVVELYQRPVVGYLQGMLGDRDDALDAAQEVFVRVLTRARSMDPDSSLRAWTYRVATNVAIDVIRRRKRWRWLGLEHSDGSERDLGAAVVPTPEPSDALQGLLDRERAAQIRRAVTSLPPRYRAVLVLRDLEELSYEDVAKVLRVSLGTVKSRVNRARNLLRDKLATAMGTDA